MDITKKGCFSMNVPKKKVIGVLRNNENAVNNNCLDILHSKRRMDWTREWLLKRGEFDHKDELLPELRINEIYHFNHFFQMTEKQFNMLVNKLGSIIVQQEPQRKKKSFSAEERLAITLKYLATGEVHSCRHYCFRASQNVLLKMIAEISMKIYENLKDEYMKLPTTQDEWRKIIKDYYDTCKMPNCLGGLEIRHLVFKPINKKGQMRDNRFYSDDTIILCAIIDSNSNFIYASIDGKSNLNDKEIFNNSIIKKLIEMDVINIPKNDKLPNSDKISPCYFVSNHTLPLKPYIMKEYYVSHSSNPQLYFDFKMWQVTERSEQCFQTLTNMFPILLHPFRIDSDSAKKMTLGCIALYNFLRKTIQNDNIKTSTMTTDTTIQNDTDTLTTNNGSTTSMSVNNDNSNSLLTDNNEKMIDGVTEENDDDEDDEDEENAEFIDKSHYLIKIRYQNHEKDESAETQRTFLMNYFQENKRFDK